MFQTSDGVLIDYEFHPAEGEVVTLLNGIFMNCHSWDFLLKDLKGRYSVLTHNFRCQWTSSNGDCSFEKHVQDLKELCDHLNIDKLHLVGTSYGAEVGMHFAIKYPQMVKSLVVITATARVTPYIRNLALRWKAGAETKDPIKFVLSWLNDVYSEKFIDEHPDLLSNIVTRMSGFNYEGAIMLLDSFLQMEHDPLVEKLSKIDCPTLVIVAEYDRVKPPHFSYEIASQVKGSKLVCIPDTGHAIVVEKPWIVSYLVRSHLALLV
ncbi:alpha/beta fold hydrolase [Pseudothermotoga sp.]|nr:alpha/beta hydrolase [Pseudothermotoga sp.]MCX7813185.1 alpha/beta hydrolase [Pseudothermotoga sp.]MDW8140253.1 alpha/beta hydrolase [Pseudothermotoga sp.]